MLSEHAMCVDPTQDHAIFGIVPEHTKSCSANTLLCLLGMGEGEGAIGRKVKPWCHDNVFKICGNQNYHLS